jgi:hypothetical protein
MVNNILAVLARLQNCQVVVAPVAALLQTTREKQQKVI